MERGGVESRATEERLDVVSGGLKLFTRCPSSAVDRPKTVFIVSGLKRGGLGCREGQCYLWIGSTSICPLLLLFGGVGWSTTDRARGGTALMDGSAI